MYINGGGTKRDVGSCSHDASQRYLSSRWFVSAVEMELSRVEGDLEKIWYGPQALQLLG